MLRRPAARAQPSRRVRGRTRLVRRRGTQPAPASAQQNALGQPGCNTAAGERSRCGRGEPRPPGSSEGGQVGHLQAAGRELVGEPPRVAAGCLAGALAHDGVRQRPGDRQPPHCLAGDPQPLRELRGGQEVAASSFSIGEGGRGAGMSAAARARASASSSPGGTRRFVSWWVFCVLGFVMGS